VGASHGRVMSIIEKKVETKAKKNFLPPKLDYCHVQWGTEIPISVGKRGAHDKRGGTSYSRVKRETWGLR